MIEYKVIKSRNADSDHPFIGFKGDTVSCGESSSDEEWAGWIFCKTENNEGWIPKQILDRNNDCGILLEDYDATEFKLEIGEIIMAEKSLNGWIWGFKKDDPFSKAWAPLNHCEKTE